MFQCLLSTFTCLSFTPVLSHSNALLEEKDAVDHLRNKMYCLITEVRTLMQVLKKSRNEIQSIDPAPAPDARGSNGKFRESVWSS